MTLLDVIWDNFTPKQVGLFGSAAMAGGGAALWRNRYTAAYRLYKRRYPAPAFDSVRQSEVDRLKKAMQVIDSEKQQFIVFYGPRGVGKSTIVASAFRQMKGVAYINMNLKAGNTDMGITDKVLKVLWPYTNLGVTREPQLVAQSVIDVYSQFRSPPWVVLDLVNKNNVFLPEEAVASARELSRMGLCVLVDASEGAVGTQVLSTSRGVNIYVDYMGWDLLIKIPEFQELLKTIEDAGLTSLVQEVIGGCPLQFQNLQVWIKSSTANAKESILDFLKQLIYEALDQRLAFSRAAPGANEILQLFATQESVPAVKFESIVIPAASVARVLRFKEGAFVPRYPAMGYILKHKILTREDVQGHL